MRQHLFLVVGLFFSFLWHLPQNLLILFLKLYRKIVSPLYGQVCRYFPSCSAYALEAITFHGAIKGSSLAVWRILRCNPWSHGGVDHVPQGKNAWPENKRKPEILVLNHPRIPDDI